MVVVRKVVTILQARITVAVIAVVIDWLTVTVVKVSLELSQFRPSHKYPKNF